MKKLVPYTIIPNELYVERGADRQLARNLHEMVRPAYILVARQMGKTNLLLHTKEILESPNDHFVYVDMSTSFTDERDCFRTIIDLILELYGDHLGQAGDTIIKNRILMRPPSREHDLELRTILKFLAGKLVIVLDEIDSLTNAPFSDRVFAHIRSVYFSRTNYEELNRVTYILSGVVEPNEIIKDKKISPFNIGEKIYLDDFSADEILRFTKQAELNLSEDVLRRLGFWTGGNPRMLWDICSKAEDACHLGLAVDRKLIDETVNDLYLRDFTQAPVDHIRQLVAESSEIRSGVRSLIDGEPISDASKIKLYLSGIIRSNFNEAKVEIKNEVIARALSKSWLAALAADQRAIFSNASERFERGHYAQALELYQQYYESGQCEPARLPTTFFQMGMCNYHLRNYKEAITWFSKCNIPNDKPFDFKVRLMEGVSYFKIAEYDNSVNILSSIRAERIYDETYFRASINISTTLLSRRKGDDLNLAAEILSELPAELGSSTLVRDNERFVREYQTVVYYNLGTVEKYRAHVGRSIKAFEESLKTATKESLPTVKLRLAELDTEDSKRKQSLSELVTSLKNINISMELSEPENLLTFGELEGVDLIISLFSNEMRAELDDFLRFACERRKSTSPSEWLNKAGQTTFARDDTSTSFNVFKLALEKSVDKIDRYLNLRWLVFLSDTDEYWTAYLEVLDDRTSVPDITFLEISNVRRIITHYMDLENWRKALDVIQIFKLYRNQVDRTLIRNFIGFDGLELFCLVRLGERERLQAAAEEALLFSKSSEGEGVIEGEVSVFRREDFTVLKQMAEAASGRRRLIDESKLRVQVPKFGRNQRVSVQYTDGRTMHEVKFKRVEADLSQGKCRIIETHAA